MSDPQTIMLAPGLPSGDALAGPIPPGKVPGFRGSDPRNPELFRGQAAFGGALAGSVRE